MTPDAHAGRPSPRARNRWSTLIWLIPTVVVALALVVLGARWLVQLPEVRSFLTTYPGRSALPEGAPLGLPAWLGWQHALNAFFVVLIIRTGWVVRTTRRPSGQWTRNNTGLLRTKRPPTRITLELWTHLSLDVLWVLNGVLFIVLLFATGQWLRVVPTSWDIVPNALSAALQYASLEWPVENGWVNYNALQVLSYFAVVFLAAPLAIATGLRMSGAWPKDATRLNRIYPIELARAVHFPVMLFFVLFVVVHVTLVFATGALRNLNHLYAASDDAGWTGFWIFAVSVVVIAVGWVAVRPAIVRPIAALLGKVTR